MGLCHSKRKNQWDIVNEHQQLSADQGYSGSNWTVVGVSAATDFADYAWLVREPTHSTDVSHLYIHSFIHSIIYSFNYYSFINLFIQSFIRSFNNSFNHLFIRSFKLKACRMSTFNILRVLGCR